jgi:alkaline phosphatase D
MGDNIYGDSPDVNVLREKYQTQLQRPDYVSLLKDTTVIGTWDDHDYGANDAGKDYPSKQQSQAALLDFLYEPANSPRRQQAGVYSYHDVGSEGQNVRIFLLDTRYFRDEPGEKADILGEAQWTWLEKNLLESKASLNLIVSSIQVIPEDHRFEKWANFPTARQRLLTLLARPTCPPVMLCSGDRHLAEISELPETVTGYPLIEITSSGLNQSGGGKSKEQNRHRQGENYTHNNFGALTIDWTKTPAVVTAAIHNLEGAPVRAYTFSAPTRK